MKAFRISLLASGLLLSLWAGAVLGVSFLATPVKFMAPSLTLPVALDVGRQTFQVFSQVELAAAAVAIVLCGLARPGRAVWTGLVSVCAILAVQSLWLLPILDARLQVILEGGSPPASPHHLLYIALEAAKAGLLLFASIRALRRTPLHRG
jgi:hypothetical protein